MFFHLAVQLAEVALGCALRSGGLLELLIGLLYPGLDLAHLRTQRQGVTADCKSKPVGTPRTRAALCHSQ